jgi:flagellar P-ring protein precursor FlgI
MFKKIKIAIAMLAAGCMIAGGAEAARIKDIAGIGGVRDNQLIGYGLVVGLAGTGDNVKNGFTRETLANMLTRQGLSMKDKDLKSNNIAAVMVTAKLPAFAKIGSKIDVEVSSVGDAKSLLGGTLLMTPLRGADSDVYAVAQGPITLGGFSTSGAAGGGVSKNHTTVGAISNGAFVEKELKYDFEKNRTLFINLYQADFTTSTRLANTINSHIREVRAELVDSSSVTVTVNKGFDGSLVRIVSLIENLDVSVDSTAVVILNEKTGTVVMGERVRISTVAVAHGNLSIEIKEEKRVSQPLPFAPRPFAGGFGREFENSPVIVAPGGQTVVTPETKIAAAEDKKQLMLIPKGVTIQEVVKGLNAIGVSPRDLITILQGIKAAGALQADLRII